MTKPALIRLSWLNRIARTLLLIGVTTSAVGAEPPQAWRLELKSDPDIERGRISVVKGETGEEPHRFLVDGMTVEMPIVVMLRSAQPGRSVDLNVTKYAWSEPLRSGSADVDPLEFRFRTEGEFQLSVSAEQPDIPYRLLVWVGEPVKPDFPPVLVPVSEYPARAAGFGVYAIWLVAAAAVAVLLWFVAGRRKRNSGDV